MRGNQRNRLLLEDLVAKREPDDAVNETAPTTTVAAVLSLTPVPVPAPSSIPRRARRQVSELEQAARLNLRSAEEARRALADEHRRLEEEASARARAADELETMRRELDRMRRSERERADAARRDALRAAQSDIEAAVRQARADHDRVVEEVDRLRTTLTEHDTLLEEYALRLREEQQARIGTAAELERAQMERELAERTLERSADVAREQAESELRRATEAENALAGMTAERDSLAAEVAELRDRVSTLEAQLRAASPLEPGAAPATPATPPDRPPLARRQRKERPGAA